MLGSHTQWPWNSGPSSADQFVGAALLTFSQEWPKAGAAPTAKTAARSKLAIRARIDTSSLPRDLAGRRRQRPLFTASWHRRAASWKTVSKWTGRPSEKREDRAQSGHPGPPEGVRLYEPAVRDSVFRA